MPTQEERREQQRQEERAARRREEALEAARERAREEEREREREEERRQEALDRQREFEAAEQKAAERRARYRQHLRDARRATARDRVREAQRHAAHAAERAAAERAQARTESARAERNEDRREEQRAEARAEARAEERLKTRRAESRAEAAETQRAEALRADRAETRREEQRQEARDEARAGERAEARRAEARADAAETERAESARAERTETRREEQRQEARADARAETAQAERDEARREDQRQERREEQRAEERASERAEARREEQRQEARAETAQAERDEERREEQRQTRREDQRAEQRASERAEARRAEARAATRDETRTEERARELAEERAAARREQERAEARAAERRAEAEGRRRSERAAEARKANRKPARTSTSTSTRTRAASPASESLPRLRVRGRLLVDAEGDPVTLRGFTFRGLERATPEDGAFRPAVTDADVATLDEWGANAAVVPIAQDLALAGRGEVVPEAYLSALDDTISSLAAAGVYTLVQLSLLSSTLPSGVDESGDRFDPALPDPESLDLWALLARRYSSSPSVVFDLFRAPHAPDPGDPLGALLSGLSWGLWRRWLLAMLGHVRREHPGALAVVRGLDRGRDLSGFPLRYSDGSLPPNVVYGAGLAGDDTDEEVLRALDVLGRKHSCGVLAWRAGPERGTVVEAQGRRLARAGQHWIADDWMGASAAVVQPIGRLGGPGILGVRQFVADAVLAVAPPAACTITRPFAPAEGPVGPKLESPYLTNPSDLLRAAQAEKPADRRLRIVDYLTQVTARWNAADGAGLIAVLDRVRSTEAKMTTSPVRPIAGLPQNAPATFRELLMHDAGGTAETKLGRDLVLGTRKVADLSSAADTQRAIMNLRRLDDVLVRIIAAHDVAAFTGAPLEDVLALYRTEGDLGVPVDDANLKRGVPPGRADQSTHLNPEPDISHLVWIVRDSAFSAACGDVVLQDWALIQWMIQLAGLDDLGRDFGNFGTWSSANWRDAGRVDSPATATARWQAARGRFVVDRDRASHTGASRAHVVPASDPLALVKAILVEGVFFLLRLGRVESLVGPLDAAHPLHATRLTPGLTYLHYHAQRSGSSDMRTDLPMPKLKGMLLSGLSAAATKGTAALRKAIADAAAVKQVLVDVEPAIEGTDPAATIAAAEAHWAVIEGWLRTDANLALLSGFVESADATAWHGWTELRGNMSRYRVLREYYRLLVAGP